MDLISFLLPFFLYPLLLMTSIMALTAITGFIDGSILSQGMKPLRSVIGVIVILMPVPVIYTLFVDEEALVWVGVSWILFFSTGLLLVFAIARDAKVSLADVLAFIREARKLVQNADKLVRLPDQGALPVDEDSRVGKLESTTGVQLKPKSPEGSLGHDLKTIGMLTIIPLGLFIATYFVLTDVWLTYVPTEFQPYAKNVGFFIALMVESLAFRATAKNSNLRSAAAQSKASYVAAQVMFGFALLAFIPSLYALFATLDGVSSDAVFLAGGFSLVCIVVSRTLLKVHVTESMSQAMSRDTRPPVLYLRPFSRESFAKAILENVRGGFRQFSMLGRIVAEIAKFALSKFRDGDSFEREMDRIFKEAEQKRSVFGRLTYRNLVESFASGRGGFFDEQLVLANIFGQIGPYVAIARPGETSTWSDVGAAKQAFADDKWQEAVIRLIVDSAIIVIEAGSTMNLSWEVEQVVRLAAPVKLLLLLPNSEQGYANFRHNTQTLFPNALPTQRPSSRFVMFDKTWSPCVLKNQSNSLEDPLIELSCARVLLPFFEQNGYTLAEHSETPLKLNQTELELCQRDLALCQGLADGAPENAQYARDLSLSYDKLGDMQSAMGNTQAALGLYQQGLNIVKGLSASAPENVQFSRDLSVSYEKLGDTQSALGDTQASLELYQQSLEITERLAASAPDNAQFARDLSVSFERLGGTLVSLRRTDEALDYYQRGLTILENLADNAPGNADLRWDLSFIFHKLGDTLASLGRTDEALGSYQRGLNVAKRLAISAPENAQFARDLSISYWSLASISEGEEQMQWWRKAHSALTSMQERGVLAKSDEKYLAKVKAKLGMT